MVGQYKMSSSGRLLGDDFLTIDVEARLRKLPSHSFRSPYHYPVELVRSALERGAASVSVKVERDRLVVADDGCSIDRTALEFLRDVFDVRLPAMRRQEAIAYFERDGGIGLIAAFSPEPESVVIETSQEGRGSGLRLEIRRGSYPVMAEYYRCPAGGTRVVVVKRRSNESVRLEREVLRDYCHYAPAAILLDGELISQCKEPADAVTAMSFGVSAALPAGREERGGDMEGTATTGTIWIPIRGEVCRTWYLHHGIRWRLSISPPQRGMIYEAVIEYPPQKPRDEVQHFIMEAAYLLYKRLPHLFQEAPPRIRERIEELLFLHYRLTHEATIVNAFAPFKVLGRERPADLPEVCRKADEGHLYALRPGEKPERYKLPPWPVLILLPTVRQWEFLVDHAAVVLLSPPPLPIPDSWFKRAWRRMWSKIEGWLSIAYTGSLVAPEEAGLSEEEADLVRLVKAELAKREGLPSSPNGAIGVPRILISRRRGGSPGIIIKRRDGSQVLVLRRGNPLFRAAARAIRKNPSLLPVALVLLTRGTLRA